MATKSKKKAIWAWTMYDWGNSAFATTIMAAVLPVYYSSVAASNLPAHQATANWGFTCSIAALIVAVISPLLGAVADFKGAKKKFMAFFVFLGVTATALLYFVKTGDWKLASALYIFGNIGFAGSLVFYDALLPHITTPKEIDQVSSRGFAMGYIGGGLLLAINLAMIMMLPNFFPDMDPTLMSRLSFVSVAIWWLVFTIPAMRYISEPQRKIMKEEAGMNPVQVSFRRLAVTFKDIHNFRDLFLFLLAFFLYTNGIGTIITMSTIYGTEIGIGQTTLIGTLLMVQFVAAPFAIAFGWLAKKIGTKTSIYISLLVYTLIAIGGYFMSTAWHFWALGFAVATVQGGSQALSRSLIGRMMPKSKSAEFYGFFSVFEKFSSIAGPALFGLVSTLMGESRLSIVSLVIFFILGIYVLSRVNVERGIKVAEEDEKALISANE
ncbi:MAG TPA: MFS transporter [Anaerolineae bacterium]|nr:MFS transporter [Anaerolineae bacterium]